MRSPRHLEPKYHNICTLYDIGRKDSMEFLVMEYLEGESLKGDLSASLLRSVALYIKQATSELRQSGS